MKEKKKEVKLYKEVEMIKIDALINRQYVKLIEKEFKGIEERDIISNYNQKLLPMGSNEEDSNILWRRKNILLNCKKLEDQEGKTIAGYYAFYFSSPLSMGYLGIGFSDNDISKSVYKRLNSNCWEIEEYKNIYPDPEIFILEECNKDEQLNKEKFNFFIENLRPEIGINKVVPSHKRRELLIVARRNVIKSLAIWAGSFDELQLIKEEYTNCIYILEMSNGKEYVGSSTEGIKRIKAHGYKSIYENKDFNLYEEFENGISNIKVYIFPSKEWWGNLRENEQELIRFIYPELNTFI